MVDHVGLVARKVDHVILPPNYVVRVATRHKHKDGRLEGLLDFRGPLGRLPVSDTLCWRWWDLLRARLLLQPSVQFL